VSIAVTRHRYQSDSAYKSSSVRMVWLKPRLGEDEKPDIETVKVGPVRSSLSKSGLAAGVRGA
jgi:hypothetical protein